MTDFFAMGGYAAYVWSAYTVVALVMLANIILPRRRERRMLAELAQTTQSDSA